MFRTRTRHELKSGLICIAALMFAAGRGLGGDAETQELRKKHDELKAQQAELAAKTADIAKELDALRAKLHSRQEELDKNQEIQDLRKAAADAQAAAEEFVKTDPELAERREARARAQSAVEPTRHMVLGATDESKALGKERAELEFNDAMLDIKLREKDFVADRRVAPRVYNENSDLSAAARNRESLARQIDQARRDAEIGSDELKNLRTGSDEARAAYEKAYNAARPAELDELYKLRAGKETAFQTLTTDTLKDEDKALSEARSNAARVRNEVTDKDKGAVALRDTLDDLHRQRAEIDYQIALADYKLREGVARRIGFDPEVRKAEGEIWKADNARRNKENTDPGLAASRRELDELRRKINGLESEPGSLPEVAAARAAWQEKEKAFNELRARLHAEAVADLQPAYEEAARAEESLRKEKFAADKEMAALNADKAALYKEREAGYARRQEIDAEWQALFEKTNEDEEVKSAREAAVEAAKAYDEAYAASEAPKLQDAARDAWKALRDKTDELRRSDEACAALSSQLAEVQRTANDLSDRSRSVANDLDDTVFQIAATGLGPAAVDKKNLANGLVLRCFETQILPASDFEKGKPVKTVKAEAIDLSLRTRDENIGLAFEGYLEIPKDGEYTLSLASDDGSFLHLSDLEIINNDGHHGVLEKTRKLTLSAGMYPIKVTFFQGGGGLDLAFKWSCPDMEMQPVPASAFYAAKEDLLQAEAAKTAE